MSEVSLEDFGAFTLGVRSDGIGVATFSRPPVNAISISVYENIGGLASRLENSEDVRVLILCAPEGSRAWCGGADLRDFEGITPERRKERYRLINATLPRLHALKLPTIAAINGATVGMGVILAGLCDFRIASEHAGFSCPEIDFGLIAGSAGVFAMLRLPEPKMREMLYTGATFTARELESTGFFNYVTAPADVMARALALAEQISRKSPVTMRARKVASLALDSNRWFDSYLQAQAASAAIGPTADSEGAIHSILHRE